MSTHFTRLLSAAVLATSPALAQTGVGPFGPISDFDVWGTTGVEFDSVTLEGRVCGNKYMDLRHFVVGKDTSIAADEDVVLALNNLILETQTSPPMHEVKLMHEMPASEILSPNSNLFNTIINFELP